MDAATLYLLLFILHLAVLLYTSLSVGLSLVSVKPSTKVLQIFFTSVVGAAAYGMSIHYVGEAYGLLIIYFLMLPVVQFIFRLRFLHASVAVLLAMMFDLAIVKLLEFNIFDILAGMETAGDLAISAFFTLFVLMNNIFISMMMYQKAPVLFPDILFSERDVEQAGLYRFHLSFVLLILLTINAFLFYTYIELPHFTVNYRVFVILWGLVIIAVLMFFLRNTLLSKIERVQFFLDQQYQKDLLSFYSIIRSQRHDFNLHLNSLFGMLSSEQYDASRQYIEDVVKEVQQVNELLPLKHPATGAMLHTFRELAAQKGIAMEIHVLDDLRDMPCSVYEMNKILGNLVQNAMDEAEGQQQSDIIIEIDRQNDQIVIRVTNETNITDDALQQMFAHSFSTKEAHEGIGLPSIQRLITKYGGIIVPELYDHKITMTVRIPVHAK
ncbi:sensor histidine kinase [Ornithinibacillus gellani]|uniref:sensor histidine kinase n=1 Tax=Ornithinibacillus gellani TaxID=2293253 RepID=UPI0016802CC2|nr:GHKL domain-containing protein [Ornithinibacillus gellani]